MVTAMVSRYAGNIRTGRVIHLSETGWVHIELSDTGRTVARRPSDVVKAAQ